MLSRLIESPSFYKIMLPYPARGGFRVLLGAKLRVPGAYYHSVKRGKALLLAEIKLAGRNCPQTKMILTGYSQGAQVVADVLQRDGPFPNIAATVLFGDPYFNGRDPVDRGSPRFRSGEHGGLGRRALFTEKHVLSYCHANDPVCQNRANPIDGFTWHEDYDKLGEPADAARVVAKWLGVHGSRKLPRLLADGYQAWQVRPAHISYTGDGTGWLGGFDGTGSAHPGHLKWSSWTQQQATGSGAVWLDDCNPDCAAGTFTAYPVRVNAFRPIKTRFTRLTLRYTYQGKSRVDQRGIRQVGKYWAYYIVGG